MRKVGKIILWIGENVPIFLEFMSLELLACSGILLEIFPSNAAANTNNIGIIA